MKDTPGIEDLFAFSKIIEAEGRDSADEEER